MYKNSFLVLVTILYFSSFHAMEFTDLSPDIVKHICNFFIFNTNNIPKKCPFQINEQPEDVGNLYDQYYNPLKHQLQTLVYLSLVNTQLKNLLNKYFTEHTILKECLDFHRTKSIDLFCFPYKSNNEIYYWTGKLSFCPEKFCFFDKQYHNHSDTINFQLEQSVWLNKQCNYGILIFIEKEDTCVSIIQMTKKILENSVEPEIAWKQCIDYAQSEACKEKINMWRNTLQRYISVHFRSHITTNILPNRNVYTHQKYLLLSERFDCESFDTLMKLKETNSCLNC